MFDKFHLIFNFKSNVSRDVFKTKVTVNWHLHFLLKCYLNVTRLIVRVISISKVSIDAWVFFFTSHTTCQNLNCACQLMCSLLLCKFLHVKMSKTCKNFVKNTHWWQALDRFWTITFHCLSLGCDLNAGGKHTAICMQSKSWTVTLKKGKLKSKAGGAHPLAMAGLGFRIWILTCSKTGFDSAGSSWYQT